MQGSRLAPSQCIVSSCLFVIFQRHNTIEHGGKLSRSKRNAALQVCVTALPILVFFKIPFDNYLVFQICVVIMVFIFHRLTLEF